MIEASSTITLPDTCGPMRGREVEVLFDVHIDRGQSLSFDCEGIPDTVEIYMTEAWIYGYKNGSQTPNIKKHFDKKTKVGAMLIDYLDSLAEEIERAWRKNKYWN